MSHQHQLADQPVDAEVMAALARRLTVWAGCAFGLSVLLALLSLRCLYADGAYELIEVLKAGGFAEIVKTRVCAEFVNQFPVVLALKLGVTNLHALELAFGLGCFLPWPISLMMCHWLAPRHFWLVMLGCAAGFINAGFLAVGESNIAHAFFWPVLFAILFARPLKPLAAAVLLVSALILLFSYESLLFLGPPLAVLAAWRAWRSQEPPWARLVLAGSALLLVLAAKIALHGVRYPESPNNLGAFKHGMSQLWLNPTWPMVWTIIWLGLAATVCLSGKGFTTRHFRLEQALFAWAIVVWAMGPILHPESTGAERQHAYRSLQLFVPFGLLVVAWCLSIRPTWFAARQSQLVGFSASLLLAQSLWLLALTWQWHGFVGLWRGVLASHQGPVSLADTPFAVASLRGQTLNFEWNWANPCLSILLSPGPQVQSMILSGTKPPWQPFDPCNPKEFPNLRRYGLSYDDYIAALQKSPVTLQPGKLQPISAAAK